MSKTRLSFTVSFIHDIGIFIHRGELVMLMNIMVIYLPCHSDVYFSKLCNIQGRQMSPDHRQLRHIASYTSGVTQLQKPPWTTSSGCTRTWKHSTNTCFTWLCILQNQTAIFKPGNLVFESEWL